MSDSTTDDPTVVSLPDGRTLAYAEYGDPDGTPVLCFHGLPGSRRMWSLFDQPAREVNARVVAPDRPGFGHSDFQDGRRLVDWPDDVRALTEELDIDEFRVVGFSAGGPHALVCRAAMPDRVTGTVLVSSPAPPGVGTGGSLGDRLLVGATRFLPGVSRLVFGVTAWLRNRRRDTFEDAVFGGLSDPDRELFDGPAGDVLRADAVESFRHGGRGAAYEFPMVGSPWGVDLATVPGTVSLWHGREDASVDPDDARAFADALPDGDLALVDEGHYSTLVRNRAAILLNATDTSVSRRSGAIEN